MKTCTKCNLEKPVVDFWPDRRRGCTLSRCKQCKAEYARQWRAANPHKGRERYWSDPQGERERHLVRKYGVTQLDYDRMLADQNGGCAICGKQQDRALDVDHDHATGAVRGLLCTNCNRMIGHAGDDAERLEVAASYLRATVPQVAAEFIKSFAEAA